MGKSLSKRMRSKRKRRRLQRKANNPKPKPQWYYHWHGVDAIGDKPENKGQPLSVIACNEKLQTGQFLLRFGGRYVFLRDSHDWHDFEQQQLMGRDIPDWKQMHPDSEVVTAGGIYVKLKHVRAALREDKKYEKEKITLEEILEAWGVNHRWDSIIDSLKIHGTNYNKIDVVKSPLHHKFEKLWQQWLDKGICDHVETLYHGTSTGNVADILKNGFRLPGSHGQAFGPGIYLGPITKARNYVRPYSFNTKKWKDRNPKNLRFLIEADVLVGKPYKPGGPLHEISQEYMQAAGCQSIYYNGFMRPEWVVFNPAQILIRRVLRLDDNLHVAI